MKHIYQLLADSIFKFSLITLVFNDLFRSGIYQSEMRCVLVDVRREQGESKCKFNVNIY